MGIWDKFNSNCSKENPPGGPPPPRASMLFSCFGWLLDYAAWCWRRPHPRRREKRWVDETGFVFCFRRGISTDRGGVLRLGRPTRTTRTTTPMSCHAARALRRLKALRAREHESIERENQGVLHHASTSLVRKGEDARDLVPFRADSRSMAGWELGSRGLSPHCPAFVPGADSGPRLSLVRSDAHREELVDGRVNGGCCVPLSWRE